MGGSWNPELAHGDLPETSMYMVIENRNEVLGGVEVPKQRPISKCKI